MSQENVELARRLYDALNWRDVEAVIGFSDPEIEIDASRLVFNPRTYVGPEGFREMAADMEQVWEELRFEPVQFIDAGDRVVVIERLVGTGKGSGVEVQNDYATILTARDGRITRMEIGYTDRAEARAAAGL